LTVPETDNPEACGPLVSVLVPTFNRPRTLAAAVRSVLAQTYRRFEVFVVNDGGASVADLVGALGDPRVTLMERRENRGKAASLNEALGRATGKYVAYLDDDDLYYPHHLATLVAALEGPTECRAAYSDLLKAHCRVGPDGRREVLGKIVNISRDFDRFLICYFNHVLHVSLLHRRDLLEKTGPYNEAQRVLVDWDMTRRLAFFTDFLHVPRITGEFYGPVGDCDRISYRMRLDKVTYLAQVLAIRTARPPKPWPKMPDLSVVFVADRFDDAAAATLRQIWSWTFMPYQVYVPLPPSELQKLRTAMPNLVRVPVIRAAGPEQRLDEALARCEGDYVAVVPPGLEAGPMWVEEAYYAALHHGSAKVAFQLGDGRAALPAVVMGRDELRGIRGRRRSLSLAQSLAAEGVVVRKPAPEEMSFRFDAVVGEAKALESEGSLIRAAALYRQAARDFGNVFWMQERAAECLYRAGGRDADAMDLARELNRARPSPSTLLLEARLHRRADRTGEAVALLERAERVLAGEGSPCV